MQAVFNLMVLTETASKSGRYFLRCIDMDTVQQIALSVPNKLSLDKGKVYKLAVSGSVTQRGYVFADEVVVS